MQVELRRQSRFPSFAMLAMPWFPFYSGSAPAAHPRVRQPDASDEPMTFVSLGSREARESLE